jgi:hypothetical protein
MTRETLMLMATVGTLVGGAVVGLFLRTYLPAYVAKKAENLATKEDVALITATVETIKTRNAAEIELLRHDLAAANARLQAQLAAEQSSRNARLDYEYEARKRLYTDVAPLLFQFGEAAEVALRRTSTIAINVRRGELRDDSPWLLRMHEYYATYTMYSLLLPAAIFRLIREKITAVDMSLDPGLHFQYRLAKQVYLLWRSDFDIKRSTPHLRYKPHIREGSRDSSDPTVYCKQGLASGHLETATAAMLLGDGSERRPKSYEQFTQMFREADVEPAMAPVAAMFHRFLPQTRPVLWRILAGHAILYRAVGEIRDQSSQDTFDVRPFTRTEIEARYDWGPDKSVAFEYIVEPFTAAYCHLGRELQLAPHPDYKCDELQPDPDDAA